MPGSGDDMVNQKVTVIKKFLVGTGDRDANHITGTVQEEEQGAQSSVARFIT